MWRLHIDALLYCSSYAVVYEHKQRDVVFVSNSLGVCFSQSWQN